MTKIKKKDTNSTTSKNTKLYQNLLKSVEQFVTGKSFTPLTKEELIERLQIAPFHTALLDEILDELVTNKILECKSGRYSHNRPGEPTIVGILRSHHRGFGFLKPEDPNLPFKEVFIPKQFTMNAVDGDMVEVVIGPPPHNPKGPEGKVVSIIERGRTHLAGTIYHLNPEGSARVHVPLLGKSHLVIVKPTQEAKLKYGDRVVLEVKEWGSKDTETVCVLSHVIGNIDDASIDIDAAIEEFDLHDQFPRDAIEEALAFGTTIPRSEIGKREDLREWEIFTIDPDTAKDFDDALSLTKNEKGHYFLGVHIADVSFYVSPGTALDEEAHHRCNSTYFPGRCLPMIPSDLSDNLCSLKEKVNRLTVSVLVEFDPEGEMVNYRIARTVIRSQKRFTYRQAKEILDGKKKSKHAPTLNLMVELCALLKKQRYSRGSIEFSMPELVILVDPNGDPTGTDLVEYDVTHQLVEEFMLKANELVATHLSKQGKNLTYRVHDEPATESMQDFASLAAAFGFQLPDPPSTREIQKMFDETQNTPYAQYLATSFIRKMRLALYSADNIGHFGLGLTHYCHFTSPIRRYVDLVVHRILFGEKDDKKRLDEISLRCSERERLSAKAEQSVVMLKKYRLIQTENEINRKRQYEAIITKVKPFGVFFDLLDYMIEGFLHVSELQNDYYIYSDSSQMLRGDRTGESFHAGDRILVMLKSIDLITQEAQWYYVDSLKKERSTKNVVIKEDSNKRGKARPAKKDKSRKSPKSVPTKSKPAAKPKDAKKTTKASQPFSIKGYFASKKKKGRK